MIIEYIALPSAYAGPTKWFSSLCAARLALLPALAKKERKKDENWLRSVGFRADHHPSVSFFWFPFAPLFFRLLLSLSSPNFLPSTCWVWWGFCSLSDFWCWVLADLILIRESFCISLYQLLSSLDLLVGSGTSLNIENIWFNVNHSMFSLGHD